ncbi:MAG: bifunctional (p)ppGpp synthetase/guanosine-3',5'-bis(diphosphate) 3'-pyrophosphohydrolase [Deltaproteobacteria bacterium]|nr:bifunctional (p)ppGpp synthetase/guanosine-3',5'-bis(diphosphate) 3'-pyrophosphohydrolase [Deltaproteobacteria bacterium]
MPSHAGHRWRRCLCVSAACYRSTVWSPDKFVAALKFAGVKHSGQRVPDSELPYVVHVTMVASEVMSALTQESFGEPDLAVQCALLHDCLEDTETSADELGRAFGDLVLAGVQALTKDTSLPKSERMPDSLRRIQAQPREVRIVKLADRITNLQPPPRSWDRDKRIAYRGEAGVILDALGAASPYLAERMRQKITDYEGYCR